MNTKKQGDIALGDAISYFTQMGYTVCIPLTDNQNYDLVADMGNGPKRIEIKRTTYKNEYGNFCVSLTVKGGNQTGTKIKKFDKSKVDYLYILTGDNSRYLIPVDEHFSVTGGTTLGKKYEKFRLLS